MAGQNELYLKALSGYDCLNKFAIIGKELFGAKQVSVSFKVSLHEPLSYTTTGNSIGDNQNFLNIQEDLISRPYISAESFTINCTIANNQNVRIYYTNNYGITGVLRLDNGRDNGLITKSTEIVKALDVLNKHFNLLDESTLVRESLPKAEQMILKEREATVKSLEVMVSKLGVTLSEQMVKDREHVRIVTTEVEQKYSEREKVLNEQYDQKHAQLTKREETLRKQQEEFDARENTAVRRELLGKITKLIQDHEAVNLSKDTHRKRWVIHVACMATMVCAIALTYYYSKEVLSSSDAQQIDWRLFLPISTGLILFASTLIYYLRWNNQWFSEHSHAEFYNQKLNADILRASWVAELFFEGDKEEGVQLPPEVIKSFTRNLFVDNYSGNGKYHPLDDVMDMIGNVAQLKIGKSGIEFSKKDREKEKT